MSDSSLVPKLFFSLIEQVNMTESLTDEVLEAYFEALNEDESFVPELVCILGPQAFMDLVVRMGGTTVKIPRVQDVLNVARKRMNHASRR